MVGNNMRKMWSYGDQRVFLEKNNERACLRDEVANIFYKCIKMEGKEDETAYQEIKFGKKGPKVG